jgi:cystathionine beta-lyase
VRDNGRELIYNQLILKAGRYFMDFDDLEKSASEGAKMIIISHPHNPGGSVWQRDELMELAAIAEKYNMLILSDEIHSDLVFQPHRHIPLASLSTKIADRTITTMAPSKTFNLAGFSTSAVIIPNEGLRKKYEKVLSTIHVGMGNTFGDIAFETAYRQGEDWLGQLLLYLHRNIELAAGFICNHIPEIEVVKPEATYMIWLDCRKLGMDAKELNRFLIHKAGLALSEGAMFGPGGEGFARMNIACPIAVIEKALQNLKEAIESLRIKG